MNKELIDNFGILAKYSKQNNEPFKLRAYNTVIQELKNLDIPLTNLNQVRSVRGIGKKSLAKIKEYLETGKISEVEKAKKLLVITPDKPLSKKDRVIELFTGVWGVGPARANALYNSGMRTLKDLKKHPELLTGNQRLGLKYYDDLKKRVPRVYIDILSACIEFVLSYEFGLNSFDIQVCGSYRRGAKESGDMDILITSTNFTLKDAVKKLTEWYLITDTLSIKGEKFMGIARCPAGKWFNIRLDIEFLPLDEWGSGMLYFTGSQMFNIRTRSEAKKKGYTLNQHGLFATNTGKRVPVYTEQEILDKIGVGYVSPEKR